MTPGGVLEPLWSYGPVLPDSFIDLLVTPDEDNAEEYAEEQDEDDEFDIEDFIKSDSDDEW